MRLHEPNVQEYLTEISDWGAQDIQSHLQEIVQDKSQIIRFAVPDRLTVDNKSSYSDKSQTLRSYQRTLSMQLNKLDSLVYAMSHKKTAQSKDPWAIHIVCMKQEKCIEELQLRNKEKDLDQKNHTYLFIVKSESYALKSIALLHRLIKINGGKTMLDDSKSITYLLDAYKQKQ